MAEYPWIEDEVISSEAKKKPAPHYPADHKVGMVVPTGGSSCAKCKYVRDHDTKCVSKGFVMWNGSDKLPAAAIRYCCDFFEAK